MRRGRLLLAVLAFACLPAPAARAQDAPPGEPRAGDTLGAYVVRPGDTLQAITERYLGTPILWPENWRLNPWIRDPDLLLPGQRLRVIVERALPPRSAQVRKVARQVDQKPQPYPWQEARVGDLLEERDGVRTGRDSSAELLLGDEDATRLTIAEQSIVFLTRLSSGVTGLRREAVEIVDGQADLAAAPARPTRVEIEILVGAARAEPRPGKDGRAEARARAREGVAELMLYAGEGEVEAAGGRVRLSQGTGTRVEPGARPTPPERLLPAPVLVSPEAGAERDWNNPRLVWSPVSGAASYTVEACRDPLCGEVLARATGVDVDRWTAPPLPPGDLHWRVTAIAASGLDGYPSKPRSLRIRGEDVDLEPPTVVVTLVGEAWVSGRDEVTLGESGGLLLAARDDASGVAEIQHRWDEGPWSRWGGEPLRPPGGSGPARFEAAAVDRLGRRSEPLAVVVQRVAVGPEAPRWPAREGS